MDLTPTGFGVVAPFACSAAQTAPAAATYAGRHAPAVTPQKSRNSSGQTELESKDALGAGKALVISSTGIDNGAYGFFEFADVLEPPFVTVPRTGSIGEARVQEFPCGVTSDCLLLIPKQSTPFEALYVAAATLRGERWRFDYSRKMTPSRIASFPLRLDPDLLSWVLAQWVRAKDLERQALAAFVADKRSRSVASRWSPTDDT